MTLSSLPRYALIYTFFLFLGVSAQAAEPTYVFARAPQLSAMTLAETWGPLLARIKKDTGINFELKVYQTRIQFQAEMSVGIPDFGYMNGHDALRAKQLHGYTPLVRDSKPLTGIIVVRKESGLKSVQELDGKTIAFPSPQAFGASLYPQALLTHKERIQYTPEYVGTHENVYRGVYLGKFPAGTGVIQTFNREPAELKSQLRILYETPPLPPHPFIAHPRVPEHVVQRLTKALLQLANDEEGRALLKKVNIETPVLADFSRDYQHLKDLDLGDSLTPAEQTN